MKIPHFLSSFVLAGLALAGNAPASHAAPAAAPARVVPTVTTATQGGLYLGNRVPLQPASFLKLPIGSVKPQGWLRQQLQLDAQGLCGNLPEVSRFLNFDNTGWVHPDKSGWEEVSYWLRGYGDLGYVLGDQKIIGETKRWVNAVMATQQPDGYFGPQEQKPGNGKLPDPWGHMPMLDVLHSYYDYTGDERALECLTKYFRWLGTQPNDYFHVGWGALRWADTINIVQWLYNKTGDASLLDLSRRIHENSVDYTNSLPNMHNVNLAQGIREPAEYGVQARDAKFLAATEKNYQNIMGTYGQFSGGGFAGDENIRPGKFDPRQGFETCGIVEFMHTFEMMTRISGNPVWADRTEELAFNSLPAALTPDHRGIHYITAANSPELPKTGVSGQFDNRFTMLAYRDGAHDYRCCPHNYGMGWPYYAEEMWLATADKGVAASLYAASEVKAKVGDGTEVTWTEKTDYPFADTIGFTLAAPKAVKFPLYLRVPRWTSAPVVKINGQVVQAKAGPLSFIVLDRNWKSGDVVSLQLPMTVKTRTWAKNKNSVSVDYGPLAFSLQIPEKWQKTGGSDAWPEYTVMPEAAWNYGLVLDAKNPAKGLQVQRKPGPLAANPFTLETVPLKLAAKGRRIPDWTVDGEGIVNTLQASPVRTDSPLENLTLVPMGAARLRITSFPTIGSGPDAYAWGKAPQPPMPPKATTSKPRSEDPVEALNDGLEPTSSMDLTIPRMTWWDHKGTAEWVQYDFKKPHQLSSASLYWFDDTGKGECRVPASWKLLYKDGDNWKPVETTSAFGVERDKYNVVKFKPVMASGMRVEVQLQAGFSGGILEWKIDPSFKE